MVKLPSEQNRRSKTQDHVLKLIGSVASHWAGLELSINDSIWALAKTEPAYGACMTAQIYSIEGRLRALLALLKLRRASKRTIKIVNKFVESVRAPSEKRNRIVHDPWGFGIKTGSPSQIRITANKKLVFRLRKVHISEIENDERIIRECVIEFIAIRDAILAELPSLPEIPLSELRPIREGPRQKT